MESNGDIGRRSAAIGRLREVSSRPYLFDQTGEFIDYWFSLPKKGLTPEKAHIDPRGMLRLLPWAIMLEQNAASAGYRIRLFGTGNMSRWGFEATNADYLNFTPPQQQSTLARCFSSISQRPCGAILSGDELYTSGRVARVEMTLFPIRTDDTQTSILFGLIATDSENVIDYGADLLASVFYTISKIHYVNIGAGIPD